MHSLVKITECPKAFKDYLEGLSFELELISEVVLLSARVLNGEVWGRQPACESGVIRKRGHIVGGYLGTERSR